VNERQSNLLHHEFQSHLRGFEILDLVMNIAYRRFDDAGLPVLSMYVEFILEQVILYLEAFPAMIL
jgi:hypothetical protein